MIFITFFQNKLFAYHQTLVRFLLEQRRIYILVVQRPQQNGDLRLEYLQNINLKCSEDMFKDNIKKTL